MPWSLSELLRRAAARHPQRVAVWHEQHATTYAELDQLADQLAGHLHALGPERRAALLSPNLATLPLALYGAWRANCGVLLLNPMHSPREIGEYLRDAGVGTVLTTSALRPLVPAGVRVLLLDQLPELLQVEDGATGAVLALADAPPAPEPTRGGDAEAVVLYTSATDGWARGAVLSHRNLISNLLSTVEAMGIGSDDRVLGALPLFHAFGLTVSLNATIAAGGCLLPVERFHPGRVLQLLEQAKPTVLAGVPAMYIALLSALERRATPNHSLRLALCGGAPLPPQVAARWEERFGIPLRQGYGITEAGPVCLFNHVDRPNFPDTLGFPMPGVEVSIRALDGSSLPVGEVGEICIRGDNVFRGYLGDPRYTARALQGDWLRTGDLGTEEPNGTFRFRGFLKPMFTRNGFNVYPRELERVLQADPRVAKATVLALPDPVRENEIVLLIRPAPGATMEAEDVARYCRANLAAYKQPSRILIDS